MFLIGVNTEFFVIADIVFLTIYFIEFLLKLYCEPCGYWKNNYNLFDFFILALSMFQFFQLLFKVRARKPCVQQITTINDTTLHRVSFIKICLPACVCIFCLLIAG